MSSFHKHREYATIQLPIGDGLLPEQKPTLSDVVLSLSASRYSSTFRATMFRAASHKFGEDGSQHCGSLQSAFSFAEENELIAKSPVRKKHKAMFPREEKPVWSAEQVRQILVAVPEQFRVLFRCGDAPDRACGLTGGTAVTASRTRTVTPRCMAGSIAPGRSLLRNSYSTRERSLTRRTTLARRRLSPPTVEYTPNILKRYPETAAFLRQALAERGCPCRLPLQVHPRATGSRTGTVTNPLVIRILI